jgi:hypothetical protein
MNHGTCDGCLEPQPKLRPIVLDGCRFLVCPDCRRAISKIRAGLWGNRPARGKPPVSRLLEPASESDRIWFENHAGRRHRIREPIGGEVMALGPPPAGFRTIIITRQLAPGVRAEGEPALAG